LIAVVGAAGTIGRNVTAFLEQWAVPFARRDFRLEGDEQVDASDAGAVARALDGSTVCVNCVDYRLNLPVMEGALEAGAHYVDLGGLYHVTKRQLELDDRFVKRGLGGLLGMGSAPGKTNLLAAAAVGRLGSQPESLEIWAATRDPAAVDHPFPAPYSVRTLLDELHLQPVVVADGQVREVEPLAGRATRELPEPVGAATGIYTLHSELATLPAAFPTLTEASFRLCLSDGLLDKLLALGAGDDEPEPYQQSPASVAVHLVDAADGGRRVVGWTLTRGGSARSTSEPAARAAVELADGRLSFAGVKPPEAAVQDPEGFLALLETEVSWEVA
jgi:saccharopine dehydrogenase-like NADP-dependent oxidoreductase